MSIGTLVTSRTGFFFGWWVVFVTATVLFLIGGTFFYGFSVLFNPIVNEFGWSRASISLAFSLRSEIGGVAAPLVGFMVDRMGPRRLMSIGVVTSAVGFLLLSRVESLWQFYGAVIVIAIGMSAAGGPIGMAAVAHWFRRLRARALAVMGMGAGASGIMVVVLATLVSALGWRSALAILAVVQLAVCFPLTLSIHNRPADLGLRPDGDPEPDPDPDLPPQGPFEPEGITVRQALRDSTFWRMAVATALGNMGGIAIIVHQVPFFTGSLGLSEGAAAASVTAAVMLTMGGRFGFGYLADQFDKRFVLGAGYGLLTLAVLLYAFVHEPWQVLVVVPLFGFGWGGVIPTRPALQVEIFGLRAFGAIQGLVFTVAMGGAFVGPVFAGWMFDQTESYRLAFVVLAAFVLLAAPMTISLPRPSLSRYADV